MELVKYEHNMPNDCCAHMSHLWIECPDTGKILVFERTDEGETHCRVWGDNIDVWSIDNRGYYFGKYGILTCHASFETQRELLGRVAKKFRDAIYYKE